MEKLIDRADSDQFEKFENLPQERQELILGAATEAFGQNSYKGASTEDIARKAGISKGLLFFYFKNKRQLYLYLMDSLAEKITNLVVDDAFYEIDDFFELLLYTSTKKRSVLERFPHILEYSIRAFYPDHKDIKDTMNGWTQRQIDAMFKLYFKNVDFSKFRDGVDPRYVIDLLIWMADGYMHQQRSTRQRISLDAMMEEMYRWCDVLKAYAYKEEYQ